jgi:hypothetical protein
MTAAQAVALIAAGVAFGILTVKLGLAADRWYAERTRPRTP